MEKLFFMKGILFRPYQKMGAVGFLLCMLLFLPLGEAVGQSVFLEKGESGMAALGGLGLSEDFSGPLVGLSYSVNGMVDVGIAYSKFTEGNKYISSFSVSSDILMAKQFDGDAVNFEIVPAIQRSYADRLDVKQTAISFGMAVSRDLLTEEPSNLIPRISLVYNNYFIRDGRNGYLPDENGNSLAIGIEINLAFKLSDHLKLILNPGYENNLKNKNEDGFVACGFLIN